MSGLRPDAIIIGAGIVGAACARALAYDGLQVLVLDEGVAGGGSTAAGMGHLVAMDDSPAQLALTSLSLRLWRECMPTLGSAVECDACGTIWIAENAEQLGAVREKHQTYATHDIDSALLGARALYDLEPNLRAGFAGGLLVPGDAVLYPPTAALRLLADAKDRGAVVREHVRVDEIVGASVRCGGTIHEAGIIINAAGAHAARLSPELPIVPRKGHLAITDRYPGFCRHQLVELGYLTSAHVMASESVAFNVQPRATGQVMIGSSRELVGWDSATNMSLLEQMLVRAIEFMPALADLSIIRTWTGFRPATPDKLPLIGPLSAKRDVWVAAGHEGLGITTAMGTARLLADLVAGRTPPIDATPFLPDRLQSAVLVA